MRVKTLWLLVIGLILASILLASCPTPNAEQEVPVCTPEGEERLLTQEDNEILWAERGAWAASTVEEATEVAGFTVVTPKFIPEDFCRNLFIHVIDPCVGLPEGMECHRSINVTQIWWWLEDEALEPRQRAILMLDQSPSRMETGGLPTEICGRPAQRGYDEAEADRPAWLSLSWEVDGMWFILSGTITGPITEEMIYEVACSVEVE